MNVMTLMLTHVLFLYDTLWKGSNNVIINTTKTNTRTISLSFQLERFLIANRDEYLRHSALNYTAEQKQYNNWLTERLLEVAAVHHYVFDPEEFNFVAVRDRIRCYYKSFVQTARKRGLPHAGGSGTGTTADSTGDTDADMDQKQSKPRVEAE